MMMVVGSLHPANLLGRCRGLVKGVPGAPTRCRTEEREGQLSSKACDGLGSNCDRAGISAEEEELGGTRMS